MKLTTYLIFDGHSKAAFTFYATCLRGRIEAMMPFGDSPGCEDFPPEHRNKIMHARLEVGDQALMASDRHPDHPYDGIKGCSVAINVTDTAEAARLFDALSEGGSVQMPLQETFWALRFGMLVDQFGVSWMVNCDKPA